MLTIAQPRYLLNVSAVYASLTRDDKRKVREAIIAARSFDRGTFYAKIKGYTSLSQAERQLFESEFKKVGINI